MSELDGMFDHDIRMHGISEEPADEMSARILKALRAGLLDAEHHGGFGSFRDSPDGLTEIEGEYNLEFVAKVIRAELR